MSVCQVEGAGASDQGKGGWKGIAQGLKHPSLPGSTYLTFLLSNQPHLDNADRLSGHVIAGINEEGEQQDEATEPGGEKSIPVFRSPVTASSKPQHHLQVLF